MKVNYLTILIAFLSLIAGLLVGWKFYFHKKIKEPQIIINNVVISVEIADTPQNITQGLSDRPVLANNWGMLFLLDKSAYHQFWMNKMKFNLDFVFIDGKQVVDLAQNIPFPNTGEQPQTVTAKVPFDKVLEINAGKVKEFGIKIGDSVKLP